MIIGGHDYVTFRTVFAAPLTARAPDGMLRWPAPGTVTLHTRRAPTSPFASFPVIVDLAGANDAVAYVDEWHWWLSQPSTATGNPYWSISYYTDGTGTRSGRVRLGLTAAGSAIASVPSSENMDRLMRNVHIYAKRLSDNAIVWIDVHRSAFAGDSFPSTI